MRTESMTIVSDPDAGDTESLPSLEPETSPALSTTFWRIAYACGDCETPLAKLAEELRSRLYNIQLKDVEPFDSEALATATVTPTDPAFEKMPLMMTSASAFVRSAAARKLTDG